MNVHPGAMSQPQHRREGGQSSATLPEVHHIALVPEAAGQGGLRARAPKGSDEFAGEGVVVEHLDTIRLGLHNPPMRTLRSLPAPLLLVLGLLLPGCGMIGEDLDDSGHPEEMENVCDDEVDNDGDDFTDCEDDDCDGDPACD